MESIPLILNYKMNGFEMYFAPNKLTKGVPFNSANWN